ncbi:MAG: FecR protein domain protein [Puniceicoccaceae bacterium 5H]|nr:MAG: FecR protein domain protein [Puniceicoccaceae bacterium 5H]
MNGLPPNFPAASLKLAAVSALTLLVSSASAQMFWTNDAGDNDFNNATNWNSAYPNGVEARINLSGADRAILDGTPSANPGSLRIGIGSGNTGEFEMRSGTVDFTSNAESRVGVGGGTGYLTQSGGSLQVNRQHQIGLDSGSTGTHLQTGGSFVIGREVGGNSLVVGDGGTGFYSIGGIGSILKTRAGVQLGRNGGMGVFEVLGSGISQIGIGSEGSVDGRWIQGSGSILRVGIDSGGITPIYIDETGGDAGGDVTFAAGSLLDVSFLEGVIPGTYTIMTWDGIVTDEGLAFADDVDTDRWSFDVGPNSLTITALASVPEPGFYGALAGLIALGAVAYRRRQR